MAKRGCQEKRGTNHWADELPLRLLGHAASFLGDMGNLARLLGRVCRSWSRVPSAIQERLWRQMTCHLFSWTRTALAHPDDGRTWAATCARLVQTERNWARGSYTHCEVKLEEKLNPGASGLVTIGEDWLVVWNRKEDIGELLHWLDPPDDDKIPDKEQQPSSIRVFATTPGQPLVARFTCREPWNMSCLGGSKTSIYAGTNEVCFLL